MGGVGRMQFSRFKALLALGDEALELADRFNVEEWKLRHILELPAEAQAEMVRQIIQFNLTGKQIEQMLASGEDVQPSRDDEGIAPETKRLVRFLKNARDTKAEDVARALVSQEKDVDLARARVLAMKRLLEQVERCLG
jgi:hypothetical protein